MDAPLYLPAAAFQQPQRLPQPLSTRTTSVADLQQDPEAIAVLKRLLPAMAQVREGPTAMLIEPLSLRDASMYGSIKPEVLNQIEAEFVKINARRRARP